MDFGYLPVDGGVYPLNNRPHEHEHEQRHLTRERTITPLHLRLEADRSPSLSSTQTTSEPETVVRWTTPPQAAPTPPKRSIETDSSTESLRRPPHEYRESMGANESAHSSSAPLVVRFDEEQIRATEAEAVRREAENPGRKSRMDPNDPDSSPPSPGTDDTPYIRFAIDQLTRDQEVEPGQRPSTSTSSGSYPVSRMVSDHGLGYMSAEKEREALRLIRKHRTNPPEGRLFAFNPTRPLSYHSERAETNPLRQKRSQTSDAEVFIPVEPPLVPRHPDLTFLPTILRPFSIIILSCLCLLMIAALMLCAIYSTSHHALVDWYGGIYGGRYFAFSFLPQILAAVIFVYVQCVMIAIPRIMPYTLMAMDDEEMRADALFLNLFLRGTLYPRWEGPTMIKISNLGLWLSVWTVPLQSCLFSVMQVDGVWRWTTVQGVAWTLVAIYFLVLGGIALTAMFFFRRTTGLMWDPRSLADMIALLPRSNALGDFPGTDIMRNKEDIRHKLGPRIDRLGYWRTRNATLGMFYCIGEEGTPVTQQCTPLLSGNPRERPLSQMDSVDLEQGAGEAYNAATRYRSIPWFLRDTFVIFWSVCGFVFLLALFITSFLPNTAIRNGFLPLLNVLPNSAGFSPANFVYSFIPSLVGMLLYLLFQPLDMAIRQLQPWAELGNSEGAPAEQSLLLDYPALLPISCTIKASRLGHWRIAFTSLISFLAILLPILAGGVFFPLTTPDFEVRMIPNLNSYYTILAILVLYLIGLVCLIPGRKYMYLPHDVDCLAEIFSFVHQSQMVDDAAFRSPRSKEDLEIRLMAQKIEGGANRWRFGVMKGKGGGMGLGIEKVGRRERVGFVF